jgi:thiol-disulfide isomerase/thioredoxin
MSPLPTSPSKAFALPDQQGRLQRFSPDQPAVVCFVKDDCPTCHAVLPVLDALYKALAPKLNFLVVGQTAAGNRALHQRYSPGFSILDDDELQVSFDWDVEIVPTLVYNAAGGAVASRLEGFVREEWRALAESLADGAGAAAPIVDWDALPEWRPGCGSMSVDPLVAERLQARASNSPLRARRIDIASQDDEFEFLFDQGMTDGLPVVPPTPERVMRMLSGTRRDPQEVVAVVPPNMGEATVEKVAINAVMAGCRPEYLPVVLAALEAVCTDAFNIHGVMATTMGASPVMVVNGPIRERLGMNAGMGGLGQGNRANATMGRALRLTVRNVGGARPGGTERSTLGSPMKFTMCFAEREERSPWQPLHVERGFAADDSVVSVFAMTSGPVLMVDQESRTASQLVGTFAQCLESAFNPKMHFVTNTLLVVCPEHVDTLCKDSWSKAQIRERIQAVTARSISDLTEDDVSATGFAKRKVEQMTADERARKLPKFRRPEDIHIVVAGGDAGKFSGAFHGWAIGDIGSEPVSVKIETQEDV